MENRIALVLGMVITGLWVWYFTRELIQKRRPAVAPPGGDEATDAASAEPGAVDVLVWTALDDLQVERFLEHPSS